MRSKILNLVAKIPSGKVTTYKIIGQKLGIKNYRLVGYVLSKNRQLVKIPCHRVVKSNGEVGGYNKGIKQKIKLLKKEGIKINNNKIVDFNKVCLK